MEILLSKYFFILFFFGFNLTLIFFNTKNILYWGIVN